MSLTKIANDIRWLGSGPRAGLGELALPGGSARKLHHGRERSIPVISESVIQAAAQVMGNDLAILQSGQGSYFELNMMMPVAAHNLLESIDLLASSAGNFSNQCIKGLKATDTGPQIVERGLMLGTALAPALGYDKAAQIAKEAAASGSTIRETALERTDLSAEDLDALLDPVKMTKPGLGGGPSGG